MQTMSMIAAVICGAGVVCLRWCWRRSDAWNIVGMLLGWLLLAAGIVVWSAASGPEFGTSLAVLTIAVAAWLVIATTARYRPRTVGRLQVRATELSRTTTARKIGTFVVGGPVAGLAAAPAVVVLARLLPISSGSQMVTAAFTYPIAWCCLTIWICMDTRLRRAFGFCLLLTLCSVYGLWLLRP